MSIVQDLVPLFAANAHALRYFDQKKQKWNYRKIGRPIMPALITQHISRGDPEFSLGAYVLRDLENSKGHALILDLDDHDGDAGALITETAVKLCTILEELALPCLLFRSGGGKGFHVYLLFEELQTKSWLRALGKFLVGEKLGMAEGASGVGSGQIEIFPNREDVPRNARVFSSRLVRIRKQLQDAGFHAEKLKSDRSWEFTLEGQERVQDVIKKRAERIKAQGIDRDVPF